MESRKIESLNTEWIYNQIKNDTENKIALFDIDSTIMDTGPRNYAILKKVANEIPEIDKIISDINLNEMGWNILDPINKRLNLNNNTLNRVMNIWKKCFFTDKWVQKDVPYKGVKTLLHKLVEDGFFIVYLTGRDKPKMSTGTIESFKHYNLPTGYNTRFFFKGKFEDVDIEFKKSAIKEIKSMGNVQIVIENEPANANLFYKEFPGACNLLFNSITSPNPEKLDKNIRIFNSYS